MMSGIQHFCFCRRQWALIHVEQQWVENVHTVTGELMHERCHDEEQIEKRDDLLIMRGMKVTSARLNLSGACDVVEFHADPENGIALQNYTGLWRAVPIEYKKGHSKEIDADRMQLCAQAMALEEMLVCEVPFGYLFYGETHRREKVELTVELRQSVTQMAQEMTDYFSRGYTPKVKPAKHCQACSLRERCLPTLYKIRSANTYIRQHLAEEVVP